MNWRKKLLHLPYSFNRRNAQVNTLKSHLLFHNGLYNILSKFIHWVLSLLLGIGTKSDKMALTTPFPTPFCQRLYNMLHNLYYVLVLIKGEIVNKLFVWAFQFRQFLVFWWSIFRKQLLGRNLFYFYFFIKIWGTCWRVYLMLFTLVHWT